MAPRTGRDRSKAQPADPRSADARDLLRCLVWGVVRDPCAASSTYRAPARALAAAYRDGGWHVAHAGNGHGSWACARRRVDWGWQLRPRGLDALFQALDLCCKGADVRE